MYYIKSNGGELIYNTVQFFPRKVAIPDLSSQDNSTDAIRDIITIFRNPGPSTPFLEYDPKDKTAVELLADIFRSRTAPAQHNPSPPTYQGTDTPSTAPTKKPTPPAPTEHVARRVPEQSEFSPGAPPRKL